jgi:hypothetical protein
LIYPKFNNFDSTSLKKLGFILQQITFDLESPLIRPRDIVNRFKSRGPKITYQPSGDFGYGNETKNKICELQTLSKEHIVITPCVVIC